MLVTLFLFSNIVTGILAGGRGFFEHSGALGTQHGRLRNDSQFYTSISSVPHLPFLTGFVGTHGTYRFMTVTEQTAVVIGEAKHGIWRIQENGFIREYRKKGRIGIRDGIDPNSASLDENTMDIIKHTYANYLPEESWSGYKYPDQRISDGKYDGMKEYINYVDLSIYHPKYGGKYNDHVPIDLPYFYCTMSGDNYPHVANVWKYAVAQPMVNRIGPLGKRAGMDIKETHFNVIRLNLFSDASVWANVGIGNDTTDMQLKNLEDLMGRAQTVNYEKIDLSKTNFEIYLIERPFFNHPYLFIAIVIENKVGLSEFSYLRRYGAYWEGLKTHGNITGLIDQPENHYPKFPVKNYPNAGSTGFQKIYGLPVYGIHHPDRHKFGLTGGACPGRGGDWGRYPWSDSGAGFPSNYQEITPLCDALVIDVKLWTNLWSESWNDKALLLGNAGFPGKKVIDYVGDANIYGRYTDPYLKHSTNPNLMDLTTNGKVVDFDERKPNPIKFKIKYSLLGTHLKYNNASVKQTVVLPECPLPTKCPNVVTVDSDDTILDWGLVIIILLSLLLFASVIIIFLLVCFRVRGNNKPSNNNNDAKSYDNAIILQETK